MTGTRASSGAVGSGQDPDVWPVEPTGFADGLDVQQERERRESKVTRACVQFPGQSQPWVKVRAAALHLPVLLLCLWVFADSGRA